MRQSGKADKTRSNLKIDNHFDPQTEEIRLQIITTAKNSNKFARESPYISNTFSRETPNFHASFHVCK